MISFIKQHTSRGRKTQKKNIKEITAHISSINIDNISPSSDDKNSKKQENNKNNKNNNKKHLLFEIDISYHGREWKLSKTLIEFIKLRSLLIKNYNAPSFMLFPYGNIKKKKTITVRFK